LKPAAAAAGKRLGSIVSGVLIGSAGVSPELTAAFVTAGVAFLGIGFDVLTVIVTRRFLGSSGAA
jgi:hypothetical protein